MERLESKGIVKSISDVAKTKSNGKQYVVCNVELENGLIVLANRTLGDNKSHLTIGQKVTCYGEIVEDRNTGGDLILWEISTSAVSAQSEVLSAFAKQIAAVKAAKAVEAKANLV